MSPGRFSAYLGGLLGLCLLLAGAAAALVLFHPQTAKPWLEKALAPAGGSLVLGRVQASLSPLGLVLDGVRLEDPSWGGLELEHLELRLRPVWPGRGVAWLSRLRARGLRLRIRLPLPGPAAGLEPPVWLLGAREVSLAGGELDLSSPAGRLHLEEAALSLDSGRHLDLRARASWQGRGDKGPWQSPLELRGELAPGGRRLAITHLAARGLMQGRGELELGPAAAWRLSLEGNSAPLQGLLPRLAPYLPAGLQGLGIQGRLAFRLEMASAGDSPSLKLELRPRSLRLALARPALRLSLGGRASLARTGRGPWRLGGRLGGKLELSDPPLALKGLAWELPLAGDVRSPAWPGLELRLPAGGLLWEGGPLPLGTLRLRARAGLAPGRGLRLEDLSLEVPPLGRLQGRLVLGPKGMEGHLQGKGLKAAALPTLAATLAPGPWGQWQAEGGLDLHLEFKGRGRKAGLQARVGIAGLGLNSPDGSVMVQKAAGRLELAVRGLTDTRLQAKSRLEKGEVLWGTVYLNLGQDPLEVEVKARHPGAGIWRELELNAGLGRFGRLQASGRLEKAPDGTWRQEGHLRFSRLRLGPLFDSFLRDPLADSQPQLASWRVKGLAELELDTRGGLDQSSLRGRLRLSGGELSTGSTHLQGLELDLPLAYHLGGPGPESPPPPRAGDWGRLGLAGLETPGFRLNHLELPLALVPNRLSLGRAIRLPLAGGSLTISGVQVDQPLSPDFTGSARVRVQGLDLGRLPSGGVPLQGRLAGELSPVSFGRRRLELPGRLEGEFFGGKLTVSGLAVSRPFGPGREIEADIRARGVDLEPLSRALGVGRVSGRVDIDLEGLRLAYGQPVAFRLKVRSIPQDQVRQMVSLKAVNSISVLGTGSGLSGLGVKFFASFFRQFPYDKIGFSCRLQNDVFTVKGLIHEDGVDYIVKRPPLMGISVINRVADNRISFKDMLARLKRVMQTKTPAPEKQAAPGEIPQANAPPGSEEERP